MFLNIFLLSLYFCFYVQEDNGSGNQNLFGTNKHVNTMQNHWVFQIRLDILAICLIRTTALFIKNHPVFLVGKGSNWTLKGDLWCNWTPLWYKRTTNC